MGQALNELFKNEKFRITAVIVGVTALTIILLSLFISHRGGKQSAGNITVMDYEERAVSNMDASPIFCKSILSTKENPELDGETAIFLSDNRSYQRYLQEYDDIIVVDPEQVPLVDDWFALGYTAIVYSTEKYGCAANLIATTMYRDASGNLKVLVEPSDINPQIIYSQSVGNCQQISVVMFLETEVVSSSSNIEILIK